MFKVHSGSWQVGDIVSVRANAKFGWKVLTAVWIEERGRYHYILSYAAVEGGDPGREASLIIRTSKEITSEFQYVWDDGYTKPGSVFRDTEGAIYITAEDGKVWNVETGTWAMPKAEGGNLTWSSSKNLLTEVMDASRRSFSGNIFKKD